VAFTSNTFKFNTIGIDCAGNANPLIRNNVLACNINYAVRNQTLSFAVQADSNWWGDATGPYHPTLNPAGTGSTVSDSVNFTPWMLEWSNTPPVVFDLLGPPDNAVVATPFPVLTWENTVDPDCWDTVEQYLQYGKDSTFAMGSYIEHGPMQGTRDSLTMALESGEQYYWRVLAKDDRGAVTVCRPGFWTFGVPAYADVPMAGGVPLTFAVSRSAPNPFSASTAFEVALPERVRVSIRIFDVAGREVRSLREREYEAGRYVIRWDGTSDEGAWLGPGVYFCRVDAGRHRATSRLVRLR
jgi:hypothetical protein